MTDYMVRATAANASLRAFAATTRETVEIARKAHNTSPVMTAALGRLLTAGAMMGSMMKGEKDILTLQIRGEGPGRGLTVTADATGNVKGYALVPQVILPATARGKLDVGGALMGKPSAGGASEEKDAVTEQLSGKEKNDAGNGITDGTEHFTAGYGGMLSVIKDLGMKEPYVGQTPLQTGEIAEDLTWYFASSEQTPSTVGLGVLMEKNNTVKQAGGFIVQLMPYAEESVIDRLEENLKTLKSVTAMLEDGMTPEQMLEKVLDGLEIEWNDTMPVQFYCNCDKERVEKALISIGEEELKSMIMDGKPIEVNCHFCNQNYAFSIEELKEILEKSRQVSE